jgi:hypothetical protein
VSRIPKRAVIIGLALGAAALTALLVALSLSGGSNSMAGAPTTSTTTPGGTKRGGSRSTVSAAQAWHNLAQCFRSHGYAIGDPTVNADGTSSWSVRAGGGPPQEIRNVEKAVRERICGVEFRAIPPQLSSPPPTQAELHSLVLFAGCMRDHGLADWPDPNAQGAFPLNARLLALGKPGTVNQIRACERHLPGGGIAVEHPGPGGSKNG